MKLTNRMLAAAACAIAVSAFASTANATVYTLDLANSEISFSKNGSFCVGCSLSASFVSDFVWDVAAPGDTKKVDNFINWTVAGFGAAEYDVTVKLAFSTPNAAENSGSGTAGFLTAFGLVSAGYLDFGTEARSINFADGSTLSFLLDSVLEGGLGNSTTTGVTFTASNVAPIPLPAAGLLLLGGIGVLGAVRRRGRAEA